MTGTSDIKTGLRAVIAIAVLAAALVLPAQAFAQNDCSNAGSDPTAAQYCSPSEIQTENRSAASNPTSSSTSPVSAPSGTAAVAASDDSGSLPFTGFDVGILLLVAAMLTGTGLALRRLTASDHRG